MLTSRSLPLSPFMAGLSFIPAAEILQSLFSAALTASTRKAGNGIDHLADTPGTYLFRRLIDFNAETDTIIGTEKALTSNPTVTIDSTTKMGNATLFTIRVSYGFRYVRDNVDTACTHCYKELIEHKAYGRYSVASLIPLAPEYEALVRMTPEQIDAHFSGFNGHGLWEDHQRMMRQQRPDSIPDDHWPKGDWPQATFDGTASATVSYSGSRAAAYAEYFGNGDTPWAVFKRVPDTNGYDCTNFVSQCLWAGFGGQKGLSLTSGNASTLQDFALADFRQLPSHWFGRSEKSSGALPSGKWMRVTEFASMVGNTGNGPRAYGYNNGKGWDQNTHALHVGDVLQFASSDASNYTHSAIISEITDGFAYVSQHSYDTARRKLIDLIKDWGDQPGARVRMRILRPYEGVFAK